MPKATVFDRLDKVKDLPTLPAVLEKLNTELRNPQTGTNRIAAIIEDDPAMMARILKVVNSPVYSSGQPITSLQLAVTRMGLNAVKNVALATSVFTAFTGQTVMTNFNRNEFWRHSICTGVAINVLSVRYKASLKKRYGKDLLHLVGLLHDIGKIIFAHYFADDFTVAIHLAQEQYVPLIEAEEESLGMGHEAVGAWLGRKWNLSPELLAAIKGHHRPETIEPENRELAELCYYANAICNLAKLGNGSDPVVPDIYAGAEKQFKIRPEELPDIIRETRESAGQSEVLMSVMGS